MFPENWGRAVEPAGMTPMGALAGALLRTPFRGALRRRVRGAIPAEAHYRFFELLLANSRQSVLVLGDGEKAPIAFGRARALLDDCLAGPDGACTRAAVDALLGGGIAFERSVRTREGCRIALRGLPIGRRAVLYLGEADEAAGIGLPPVEAALRRMVDALSAALQQLPSAVAVFDAAQRLAFHNGGYARLWALPESYLHGRPAEAEILDRLREGGKLPAQRDFAHWKQEQLTCPAAGDEQVWHLPDGRSLRVTRRPAAHGGKLVLIEDVSARLALEADMNLLVQVQKATLDTLDDGMAIFGPNGRLILYNAPFAALWRLGEADLAQQPHCTDIARLCLARIGDHDIWDLVSEWVNALKRPAGFARRITRRADGRLVSVALSRLPNGATIANFSDLTDIERFDRMQVEDRGDSSGTPASRHG